MSRIRTGITPDAWKEEEPSPARLHAKAFTVMAEVIPNMRPILNYGGQPQPQAGYRQKALTVKPR